MAEKKLHRVQRIRGSQTATDNFTGMDGELTINRDSHSIRVHDNQTPGGFGTVNADVVEEAYEGMDAKQDYPVGAHIISGPGRIDGGVVQAMPIGSIAWFGTVDAPNGWLICDGSAVSREIFNTLFDLIGTKFGAGDGSKTFNLPNLIGKFAEGGMNVGLAKEAGLPNIIGHYEGGSLHHFGAGREGTGALLPSTTSPRASAATAPEQSNDISAFDFDASRSNSIYGKSDTVQPASVTFLPCIKAYSTSGEMNDSTMVNLALLLEKYGRSLAYNTKTVLTSSGTFTAPVTGWYKVTCIGGGGGGGAGGGHPGGDTTRWATVAFSGNGGGLGGTTSFGDQTAAGGSGGGAGCPRNVFLYKDMFVAGNPGDASGGGSAGGGGAAGYTNTFTKFLRQGETVSVVVGAGGVGGLANQRVGYGQTDGAGPHGGRKSPGEIVGGSGAGGMFPGQHGGNGSQTANFASGIGGNGGYNGTPYGGGGGGGCPDNNGGGPGTGGRGAANGADGQTGIIGDGSLGGNGGAGGAGAVIVEYFDPAKAA